MCTAMTCILLPSCGSQGYYARKAKNTDSTSYVLDDLGYGLLIFISIATYAFLVFPLFQPISIQIRLWAGVRKP